MVVIAISLLYIILLNTFCESIPVKRNEPETTPVLETTSVPLVLADSFVGATEEVSTIASNIPEGVCECGVFNTTTPELNIQPTISKATINVTCDKNGEETCHKMCTSLAQTSHQRGVSLLCATIGHADKYRPSVFYRVCQHAASAWIYTGLRSDDDICCHENHPIECKEQSENPPANQL